jgi:hypothetical protein
MLQKIDRIEKKECAYCHCVFPRKANWSHSQWAETCYCSRPCAARAKTAKPILSTIFARVEIDPITNCWNWTACKDSGGYGLVTANGRSNQKVHRVVYGLAVSDIPEGMMVLHRCDNRSCCNPFHLFLGTAQDNVSDMHMKGRANQVSGEMAGSARLTSAEVLAIRDDDRTQEQIAADYGIAQTTVSAIKKRKNWRHV